jgi:WD40 repeat protein
LWDAASGQKLRTFAVPASLTSVILSQDNKHAVANTGPGRTAILWDTADGKILRTFAGHTDRVTGMALSDDGKHLWTVSEDRSTRLWNPATAKERCQLISLNDGKDWLVITPDGFFDGSKDAWRFVAYREPGSLKLLDDDATRKRFHRPGLLAQVWKGEK